MELLPELAGGQRQVTGANMRTTHEDACITHCCRIMLQRRTEAQPCGQHRTRAEHMDVLPEHAPAREDKDL